ncbi:MAG: DUF1269 domain-containing protein [Mogibacterium sp.]|nr:DUF1269 domain-containing protein [Mogibacterium sp.]
MDKNNVATNVVVAVFQQESEGYQAITQLRHAAGGEKYVVSAASLVKKENDKCTVLDAFDTGIHTQDDTDRGSLIGMVLGIFGGPLGVLLGGATGALIGMTKDTDDAAYGLTMLAQIADKLDDGMVALIALAAEESEDELNAKLTALNSVVARFDAKAVAAEADKAIEKQAELNRQAKEEEFEKNAELLRQGFTK